jgi:hypothetical protein
MSPKKTLEEKGASTKNNADLQSRLSLLLRPQKVICPLKKESQLAPEKFVPQKFRPQKCLSPKICGPPRKSGPEFLRRVNGL